MPAKKKMSEKVDKRYRAKITLPDGSYVYLSAKTKKELEQKKNDTRETLIEGQNIRRDITTEQLIIDWFTIVKKPRLRSYGTEKNYRYAINNHILPYIDSRQQARAVTYSELQKIVDRLSHLNPTTVGLVIAVLKGAFAYALVEQYISVNPATNLSRPLTSYVPKEKKALTQEDVLKLFTAAKEDSQSMYTLVHLMYYLGLRIGEATGLQWGDFDFENKVVHIQRSKKVKFDRQYSNVGSLKTKSSNRLVPVPDELIEYLLPLRGFPTAEILPGTSGALVTRWTYMKRRCGFDFSSHYLRHNYATGLYLSGVDPLVAMRIMGHCSYNVTINTYTHISDKIASGMIQPWCDPFFSKVAERLPKITASPYQQQQKPLIIKGL